MRRARAEAPVCNSVPAVSSTPGKAGTKPLPKLTLTEGVISPSVANTNPPGVGGSGLGVNVGVAVGVERAPQAASHRANSTAPTR